MICFPGSHSLEPDAVCSQRAARKCQQRPVPGATGQGQHTLTQFSPNPGRQVLWLSSPPAEKRRHEDVEPLPETTQQVAEPASALRHSGPGVCSWSCGRCFPFSERSPWWEGPGQAQSPWGGVNTKGVWRTQVGHEGWSLAQEGARSQPHSAPRVLTGGRWPPRAAPPSVHARLCWCRVVMCPGPHSLGKQDQREKEEREAHQGDVSKPVFSEAHRPRGGGGGGGGAGRGRGVPRPQVWSGAAAGAQPGPS